MDQTKRLFLKCLRLSAHPEEVSHFTQAERTEIQNNLSYCLETAKKHSLVSSLYEGLCLLDIPIPPNEQAYFRKTVTAEALSDYHMLFFTRKILHILKEEHVRYFLLKGVTLLECYPKLELRPFGDVDILVPDPDDFEHLKQHLLHQGFYIKNSFAEHHLEMYYTEQEKTFLLEIHHRIIARQSNSAFNRKIKEIFQAVLPANGTYPHAALSYQMLPYTENALYLLLHMLQHFLGSGFGIKLLWDWTSYLETHGKDIDHDEMRKYLHSLGLTKFCYAMTALCHHYLGLKLPTDSIMVKDFKDTAFLENMMEDIFTAGTFGKTDHSRMLIMSGGGNISQYFIELHRQMKKRFQKLCRFIPLWPFLWVATGICFLWNNYFVRKTKTKDIFATAKKRQDLIKELTLFQKGDSPDEK